MNEWEWQALEDRALVDSVRVAGEELRKGDFVRLRPREGGDIFDLALAGQIAVIESIEQDYDGKLHLAVILEDDPGKDLGLLRQPGHRFFFTPEEIEPLARAPKILIAGIGNIFLGDDGFGPEVARRIDNLPANAVVKDYGIRGYDLAYALLEPYDWVVLVDAVSRGGAPGTLYVIEPEDDAVTQASLDAHAMEPVAVLRLARNMGTVSARILVIGCEPADLGGEEGYMGLSPAVDAAIEQAIALLRKLVANLGRQAGANEALPCV